ncbi:MAG: 2Fe-2S iron-sulfur cluster-binding protein [Vicinamibacteria bacterium]|nr:2Fe-2S iron-sulfur cluster-binding protein [Vicinamibacteria bacterium]
MSADPSLILDGREIPFVPGQTILQAADDAGVYIPRLCDKPGLEPFGSCRVCVVRANGRTVSSCTYPASLGMVVESETPELQAMRKVLLEMLFVEGNHFCMSCEKSGHCELQALGYRFGITAPQFEYQFPHREVDASHPDILIDHNRCILCARCVRTSRDLDGKEVFGFVGRGPHKRLAASTGSRLKDTNADVTDRAIDACPVGALLRKRVGFAVPVGQRPYDTVPIGAPEPVQEARR